MGSLSLITKIRGGDGLCAFASFARKKGKEVGSLSLITKIRGGEGLCDLCVSVVKIGLDRI